MVYPSSPQKPDTARLANKIRKLRDVRKWTWKRICLSLSILDANDQPDTGEAYHIYSGREPGEEVRARLGLKKICVKCGRPIRLSKTPREKPNDPEHILWWKSIGRERREAIIRSYYEEEIAD